LLLSLHQSQSRSSSTRAACASQPDPGAPNRATNLRDRGCRSGRRCGCCAKACSLGGRFRMFSARGRGVVHDPVDGVLHSAQGECAPRLLVIGRGGSLHSASFPRRARRGGQRRTPLGCGCPSARGRAGRPARENPSPRGFEASLGRTTPASCQRPPWLLLVSHNHPGRAQFAQMCSWVSASQCFPLVWAEAVKAVEEKTASSVECGFFFVFIKKS